VPSKKPRAGTEVEDSEWRTVGGADCVDRGRVEGVIGRDQATA
jgi:hypothetical protein